MLYQITKLGNYNNKITFFLKINFNKYVNKALRLVIYFFENKLAFSNNKTLQNLY